MSVINLHVPQFKQYVEHLKSFGDLYTIECIWEIIDWSLNDGPSSPYRDHQLEMWESVTVQSTKDYKNSATLELEQLLLFGNPLALKEIETLLKKEVKSVKEILSRTKLLSVIEGYNLKPKWKTEKYSVDEDTWETIREHLILKPEYLNQYMDLIVNQYLLPDFESLCGNILRAYKYGTQVGPLFKKDVSFESEIKSEDKLAQVINYLKDKEYLLEEDGVYYWKGIGQTTIGSMAGVARYMEQAGIMGHFGKMADAFRAYKSKFNFEGADQNEWNKRYSVKNGIRFDDHGDVEFFDDLGEILKF